MATQFSSWAGVNLLRSFFRLNSFFRLVKYRLVCSLLMVCFGGSISNALFAYSPDSIQVTVIYGGASEADRVKYGKITSMIVNTLMKNSVPELSKIRDGFSDECYQMFENLLEAGTLDFPEKKCEAIIAYNNDFLEIRGMPVSLTLKNSVKQEKISNRLVFGYDQTQPPILEYARFDLPDESGKLEEINSRKRQSYLWLEDLCRLVKTFEKQSGIWASNVQAKSMTDTLRFTYKTNAKAFFATHDFVFDGETKRQNDFIAVFADGFEKYFLAVFQKRSGSQTADGEWKYYRFELAKDGKTNLSIVEKRPRSLPQNAIVILPEKKE